MRDWIAGLSSRGLEALIQRLEDLKTAGFQEELEQYGEDILKQTARDWPTSPSLNPDWVRWKVRHQPPYSPNILEMTGTLKKAVLERGAEGNVFKVEPFSLEMGVDDKVVQSERGYPYAYVQWHGSRDGRIPPRPWLRLKTADRASLDRAIEEKIRKTIEG